MTSKRTCAYPGCAATISQKAHHLIVCCPKCQAKRRRAYKKAWDARNREHIIKYTRAWRADHREYCKAYDRVYKRYYRKSGNRYDEEFPRLDKED